MNITKNDIYEEIAATYQCLEIARLNQVLSEHGISDKDLRKAICSDYIFKSGHALDASWFKNEDQQLRPVLCFANCSEDSGVAREDIQMLYLPSEMFAFHEYAFGNIEWYFNEHAEDASEIETGSLDQRS